MTKWIERHYRGLQAYVPTVEQMHVRAAAIASGAKPEIWILEHSPVITAGKQTGTSEIFAPPDIEVLHTDRGGKATWHGPGQLVIYPLLRLADYRLGVRAWVNLLLHTSAQTLAELGIETHTDDAAIGVYTPRGKISSLGIHVERGVSTHGVSLNVRLQPNGFQWIDPCGVRGGMVDEISRYQSTVELQDVANRWLAQLARQLPIVGAQ